MSLPFPKLIRFSNIPRDNESFGNFLAETFNVTPYKIDGQWVVEENDPGFRSKPLEVIKIRRQIDLDLNSLNFASSKMAESIPTDYDKFVGRVPEIIPASNWNGRLSEIEQIKLTLTFLRKEQIQDFLKDKVLPFMKGQFGVRYVTPIAIDPSYQQKMISITKMFLLIEKHGIRKAEELSKQGVLESILPNPVSINGYLEVFTVFHPVALTLVLSRRGGAWHFYSNGPKSFLASEQENIINQFQTSHNLSISEKTIIPDIFFKSIITFPTRRYLKMLCSALNNLLHFMNDIRSFKTLDSLIDFQTRAQMYSAIDLIFLDLKMLSVSSNGVVPFVVES